MLWRALFWSARVNLKPHGTIPRFKRAHHSSERGPSKVKWAKNTSFPFLGGAHSTRWPFHGKFHPPRQSSGCTTDPVPTIAGTLSHAYPIVNNMACVAFHLHRKTVATVLSCPASPALTIHCPTLSPNPPSVLP